MPYETDRRYEHGKFGHLTPQQSADYDIADKLAKDACRALSWRQCITLTELVIEHLIQGLGDDNNDTLDDYKGLLRESFDDVNECGLIYDEEEYSFQQRRIA